MGKRIINITALTVFIILLTACSKSRHSIVPENIQNNYYEFINSTDTIFTSHFPKKIRQAQSITFSRQLNANYNKYPMVYLSIKPPIKIFNQEIEKYKGFKNSRFNASDTNLLVINNWKSLKESKFSVKRDSILIKKLIQLNSSKYPIPNFYALKLDNGEQNPSMLSKDFDIVVLDAQKGEYWNFNELSGREYVPINWKHGYSNGVAINEKEKHIIYWTAIW